MTKNELKFILEDKDKNIILETPGGRRITLSDKNEEVIIEDPFNNKITMKNSGIYVDTPKDFEAKAQGKVLIEGTQGIQAKCQGHYRRYYYRNFLWNLCFY